MSVPKFKENRWPRQIPVGVLFFCGAVACGGNISDDGDPVAAGSQNPKVGKNPGPGEPKDPAPEAAPGTNAAEPAASKFVISPGLRRLTRAEYINSVADLLNVPVAIEDLPDEQIVEGHSVIALAQKTGYDDNNLYLGVAEKVAEAAAPKLVMEAGCADPACYRIWATGFLTRAFRGPPAAAVVDRYSALLSSADAGPTPADRLTAFVESALTSPHFLYRKEIGTGTGADRVLGSYEVATRLSFLLWQSGPDAALLAAAAKGELAQPASRLAQVDRLLKDPRASRALRSFVSDWMGLFEKELAKKAPEVLTGLGSDFPVVAQGAFDMLIDDALAATETAKFSSLLSLDYMFANSTLAKILGVTAAGSSLTKVMLKTNERRGILTHPLVLGAHTKESGASPFPIGKFIFENLACNSIPPPPAMFAPVEDTTTGDQTLRQRLEALTSSGTCANCHDRISPPGYAFLPFDAVGRYKNKDARGMPFDTKGTLRLPNSDPLAFDGASDLAAKLATHPVIQRCVAQRLFRWTFGRYESMADKMTMDEIEQTSVETGASVGPLLRKVAGAPAFGYVRVR